MKMDFVYFYEVSIKKPHAFQMGKLSQMEPKAFNNTKPVPVIKGVRNTRVEEQSLRGTTVEVALGDSTMVATSDSVTLALDELVAYVEERVRAIEDTIKEAMTPPIECP